MASGNSKVGCTEDARVCSVDTAFAAPEKPAAGRVAQRGGQVAEAGTPWFVPAVQPVDLLFFSKAHKRLRQWSAEDSTGVPVLIFQRAMSRLFRILGEDGDNFDAKDYDINRDGTVGWWEFCELWKEKQPSVRLSMPERLYLIFESPEMSKAGRFTSMLVLITISISAGSFIVSTLPAMQAQPCDTCEPEPLPAFDIIDTVCVILFTIEYLIRLLTAAFMRTELPIISQEQTIELMCTDEVLRWPTKLQRVWDFARALPNLIDLAAIVPAYVAWCLPERAPEDGSDSTRVIIKLVQLMRVVRAFRLGRRFEAVVIIARSMRRSTRAIWVLVLNMCIGTVIFGAVMFFVEQGTYDPRTQRFKRPGSWVLNENTNRYERAQEDSPFESIPHSFWWALVTATTAGYGDMSPTTEAGMVTAGICMIWSLSVIALPVGVIGANFEKVWEEYDKEKRAERELRLTEKRRERSTLASMDPLSLSTRLRIEVFHDSQMVTPENDVFIGEAEATLRIDPSSAEPLTAQLELPLCENREKADRPVSGKVYMNYSWTPHQTTQPEVCLQGQLLITLVRAEDLAQIDWKQSAMRCGPTCCDPYVVLTVYPRSPSKEAAWVLTPRVERFGTVFDDPAPTWDTCLSFDFQWKQDGVRGRRESTRRTSRGMTCDGAIEALAAFKGTPQESPADRALFSLQSHILTDLSELHESVPELQDGMDEVRQAARSLLAALKAAEPAAVATGENGEEPSHQPSPHLASEAEAGFQFVVPGMIAEEPTGGNGEPKSSISLACEGLG